MSDAVEMFKAQGDHKKSLRAKYGVECPECKRMLPKASATILLPGKRCRIHKYVDPRQELTDKEWSEA